MFSILDTLSLPGFDDRPNEDRFGVARSAAFVVDGATGLGDPVLTGPGGSDAAWIAEFAALGFEAALAKDRSVVDAVRAINTEAARLVGRIAPDAPAWALPIAAFQAVVWRDGALTASGLGDCSLVVVDARGVVHRAVGLEGSGAKERETTRAHRAGAALAGRQLYELDEVKARLRDERARFNTPGQPVWTLGPAPDAADHVNAIVLPIAPPAFGLLATDGFMALVDAYRLFDPAGLVAAARQDGLEMLGSLLRQTERVADPECRRWPRYKVSDDATAVLFEVR